MEIKIVTIPEKKEDLEVNQKVREIVLDRNKVIAKSFGVDPKEVGVNLYYSTSQLVSKVGSHDERLGVFSGYRDYEDSINLGHPTAISPIFGDNLYKQISIMVDYCLIKFYMCEIYYPTPDKYNLFFRHFTNILAKVVSGNFQKVGIDFLIKNFSDFKKYKKDEEMLLSLYVMLEKSGSNFIFENLETFIEDKDIKKSLMNIYKKEFKELVGFYQKEMLDTAKKLKKV